MASLASNEMTREEKEEFATKKMNEMRLKNQLMKQRYEEVEKDRLEAEKQCAAVTASRTKTKSFVTNKFEEVDDDLPKNPVSRKPEREWDIGKGAEGDWSTEKEHDFNSYRNSRTGGSSDNRNFRRDSNWKPRDDYNRRDNYQSYNNRQSGSFRGNQRYQGSNRGRQSNSHYDNSRQYSKSGPPRNWNEDPRRKYNRGASQSNFNNQNSYSKTQPRYDNDKIWHDGMNEAQNKQVRVERWVKSISSVESWTENEDEVTVTVKGDGHRQINLPNKAEQDFIPAKPAYVKNRCEDLPPKNSPRYEGKSNDGEFHNSNYHQTEHSNKTTEGGRKSFIDRQTEMHMHGRLKYRETQKPKDVREDKSHGFAAKSTKYSDTWGGKDDVRQKNKTGGTWSDDDDEESYAPKSKAPPSKKHSGTWSDDEGNKKDSESWTDIDDSCENETQTSKNRSSNFKQQIKPRSYSDRKDNKYSNAWNSDKHDNERSEASHNFRNERKTFGRTKSNSGTYDEEYVERKDTRNSETRSSIRNSHDTMSHSTKYNSVLKPQSGNKHYNRSESWGVEKADRHSKTSRTWNNEDASCNNKNVPINRSLKHNTSIKSDKHVETGGTWSDVEDESYDKDANKVSTYDSVPKKSNKNTKNTGTWSDVEDESPDNKDISTDRDSNSKRKEQGLNSFEKSYNTNVAINRSKSFTAKTSSSTNEKSSPKHESGVWSDQECETHNEDYAEGRSSNWDTPIEKRETSMATDKVSSSDVMYSEDRIKISEEDGNEYKVENNRKMEMNSQLYLETESTSKNNQDGEQSHPNAKSCTWSSSSDAQPTVIDSHCDTPINVSEILQQSVSEDSAFGEQVLSENNDSKCFEDSKEEKISNASNGITLSSPIATNTESEVENVNDLPKPKTDLGALSETVEGE